MLFRLIVLLLLLAAAIYLLDVQVRRVLKSPLGQLLRSVLGAQQMPPSQASRRNRDLAQGSLARCTQCGDYVPRTELDRQQLCHRCRQTQSTAD